VRTRIKGYFTHLSWASSVEEVTTELGRLTKFVDQEAAAVPQAQLDRLRGLLEGDGKLWSDEVEQAFDMLEAKCAQHKWLWDSQ